MIKDKALFSVGPILIERRCGGWLAVTPHGWPLGIGVTADTKEDAEKKFLEELERFSKIQEYTEPASPDAPSEGETTLESIVADYHSKYPSWGDLLSYTFRVEEEVRSLERRLRAKTTG